MAEADFTVLSDISGNVRKGVAAGLVPPNGGENFVYGFSSTENTPTADGLHMNEADFNPSAKGGLLEIALKRITSGGETGFSVFGYTGLQSASVNAVGYLLGLADASPAHIVLKKGILSAGIADAPPDPTNNGILLRSIETIAVNTWVHLQLEYILQGSGDAILKVRKNTALDTNGVTNPTWEIVPGMEQFIDDSLGINSGSIALAGGRSGWGFTAAATNRNAAVDHFSFDRQT